MNSHTNKTSSTPSNTLCIAEFNTHQSGILVHSLLNNPEMLTFNYLLMQEPYLYQDTRLPITHQAWTPVLPKDPKCRPKSGPQDTTKSLIYFNWSIPSTAFSVSTTSSNCVAVVNCRLGITSVTLISAHTPPKQEQKLHNFKNIIQAPSPSPTTNDQIVVGMNCNLHHPLWNLPKFHHDHHE